MDTSQVKYREDVFALDEGQAILRWPEKLSPGSLEDFKAWLELVQRKVARASSGERKLVPQNEPDE